MEIEQAEQDSWIAEEEMRPAGQEQQDEGEKQAEQDKASEYAGEEGLRGEGGEEDVMEQCGYWNIHRSEHRETWMSKDLVIWLLFIVIYIWNWNKKCVT